MIGTQYQCVTIISDNVVLHEGEVFQLYVAGEFQHVRINGYYSCNSNGIKYIVCMYLLVRVNKKMTSLN